MKFVVQFKIHVSQDNRKGLLGEIADSSGASYMTRPDGLVEIFDHRKLDKELVESFLQQEDERGTLRYSIEE